MGKNTKVMPQMPRYLSFLLGKGGNPYASNPMKSYNCKCEVRQGINNAPKIAKNMYIFSREFRTFPVTEGMKFGTSIPVQDPSKKAHPQHKI